MSGAFPGNEMSRCVPAPFEVLVKPPDETSSSGMNSLCPHCEGRLKERQSEAPVQIEDLADAVREVAQSAIVALWQFYSRPLPDKLKWAFAGDNEGLESFVSSLGETPGELISFCRATLTYDSLTLEEAQAIGGLIAIYDSFNVGLTSNGGSSESIFLWGKDRWSLDENDRRSPDRQSTAMAAHLRYDGFQHRVVVRNLSSLGVMIAGLHNANVGEAASIELPDKGWIEGVIAWSVESRCGIAFNDPIDLSTSRE